MRFVATETGQAIQLLKLEELRPLRGGAFVLDMIAEITERYRFAVPPEDIIKNPNALKFQAGTILGPDRNININSLEIYNDGIVVNARHTDDADFVIDEFLSWSAAEFGMRERITFIPRTYFSAIVVDFDKAIEQIIGDFEEIRAIIAAAFGTEQNFRFLRFAITTDQTQAVGHRTWQIEPRAGLPRVEGRFFSTAHLPTDAHWEMLVKLEKRLTTDGASQRRH